MTCFVDTSAFLAVLDAGDRNHQKAKSVWQELVSGGENLVCSNYVLLETMALVQTRLGMNAARAFQEDIAQILTVEWVDESSHQAGVTSMLAANRREFSLVDCVSFDIMRRLGIRRAFVFDRHFREQGFECVCEHGR